MAGRNNKDLGALQLLQGLAGTLGSAGRGIAASTLGAPGDIEGLIRMLIPGISNESALPNTEDMTRHLPQLPKSLQQPTVEALSRNVPLTPTQVGKLGAPAARLAAEGVHAGMMGQGPLKGALSAISPAFAVKERGGNWLRSNGTELVDDLLHKPHGVYNPYSQEQIDFEKAKPEAAAVNNWIRGPLAKYIKRDLGTANDPLLELADQGISTMPQQQLLDPPRWVTQNARNNRQAGGFNKLGLVDSGGYRKGWEDWSDGMVMPQTSFGLKHMLGDYHPEFVKHEGEWLNKLAPGDKVHSFSGDEALQHLGFGDLSDTLMRGLEENDLPPHLKLTPERLAQMGMEKAVRYQNDVQNFDREAAAVKQAAAAKEAAGHGNEVKTYDNGYQWRDLAMPEKADMSKVRRNSDGSWSPITADGEVMKYMPLPRSPLQSIIARSPEEAQLGAMLGHEGISMNHCVGGYTPRVASGETKVLSLRDKNGVPHVTMEVENGTDPVLYKKGQQALNDYDEYTSKLADPEGGLDFPTWLEENAPDVLHLGPELFEGPTKPTIKQIYGNSNSIPKQEYLPHIHDYIKSNDVEVDPEVLDHIGMYSTDFMGDNTMTVKQIMRLRDAGHLDNLPNYITSDELEALRAKAAPSTQQLQDGLFEGKQEPEYAHGGLVEGDDDFAYPGFF